MIDLGNEQDLVALFVHRPGRKLLVASDDGRGFFTGEDDAIGQTRSGKQVLNVAKDAEALVCVEAVGDMIAVVGANRRLLIFPASEVPTMTRGRGVILQRYADGTLSDVRVFQHEEGLTWHTGAGVRTERDFDDWIGKRAQAGRKAMKGFPKSNRFGRNGA
jgi:topoisomerase-4 subunit A